MPAVEREFLVQGVAHSSLQSVHGRPRTVATCPRLHPLCHWTCELSRAVCGGLPLRWDASHPLSRVPQDRAVLLPERFRGGCSFGGGGLPSQIGRASCRERVGQSVLITVG